MKIIKINETTSTIEYNKKEWNFIDSLPEGMRRMILRGMITPYDFGYKEV